MTKRSSTGKGLKAKTRLELKHSDLCGSMNVKAWRGYDYFISFIDDYSRYGHVYLIQNKSDFFEKFKEYKAEVENESSKTIKTLRSDRAAEYMDLRFQDYLIEHGIQSQLSAPSMPQQSGVSERRNRTLLDMVCSMMSFAQLPDSFLGYALETTIYILNKVPSKSVFETPYELWKGRKDCDQWVKAMDLETESIYSNSVWTLVDQPNDVKPIGCKWIYKRKRDQAGKNFKKGLLSYRYGIHLSKEQCPKKPQEVEDISNIPYASAIGSQMYAMLCTRLDICYSVGMVSRYQFNPGYARKSTSGSVFTLSGGAVVWRSIKQSCIADSTMESEYVAAKEAIWLKKSLTNLEVVPNMHLSITLYYGNSGAVANS
ncbi:gag/pol protein [Cucumis melo var. makuwa]|uniref:Gag/pol protein n=1 Tax=Cucumis melo var. makuwa TaxID=1194695 RepID=A0A5D3DIF7_CUCMM|nr:gag/pol protein [Cucumis melo var. makuwa]